MTMLPMLHPLRPECRQRRHGGDTAWADTLPLLFRSEGFAEDLGGAPTGSAALADARASSLARVGGWMRAVMLGVVVPPGHAERAPPAHGQSRRP